MVYSAESMAQVELGRQGEHLARTVQIDVSCLQRAFPEAAFALVYRLPRETALYIAEAAADRAEQAGGAALPPMTPADAGSVLAVNADGTGYTFLAIASDAETDEALQDAFSKADDKTEEKKHGV